MLDLLLIGTVGGALVWLALQWLLVMLGFWSY